MDIFKNSNPLQNERALGDALSIFDLKPATKRVFRLLIDQNVSTAADIASTLNMPKSSVYDSLEELTKKSLVTELMDEHGRSFAVVEPDQLEQAHQQQVASLTSAHSVLTSYIRNHQKEDVVARPKIRFYSGIDGIKQAFRDNPWSSKHQDAYLMWPMADMLQSLDEEFLKWHSSGRHKHQVMIHSIRSHSDRHLQDNPEGHEWLQGDPAENLREVRYAPEGTDWKMSYWIYGDKTLFASSGAEKFAFVVHSKEFAELMKLMWQQMWSVSRP